MSALLAAFGLASTLSLFFPLEADRDYAPPRPVDPRFFGIYCQPAPEKICKKVKAYLNLGLVKIPIGTRDVCATVRDGRAQIDYIEAGGRGTINGNGTARVDGRDAAFVAGGYVIQPGLARASASIRGIGRNVGHATLTPDGMQMKLLVGNRALTFRKDACGNEPPGVTVSSLNGTSLAWGENHCFLGKVVSDEDPSFPYERMLHASDRDGLLTGVPIPTQLVALDPNLGGGGVKQVTRCTSDLSPGDHVITFTATDSGGLSGSASVAVTVTNDPPHLPVIVQPRMDDTIIATGDLIFEGKAFDPEDGMLSGTSLTWSASREGGAFQPLGSGKRLVTDFPEPGLVTLRLTARDGAGLSSSTERDLPVLSFGDNTTPRVTIEIPKHLDVPGPFGGFFPPGDVTFRGTVDDTEDADGDLDLRWDAVPLQPAGPPLDPVLGSTLAVFRLESADRNRAIYRIIFTAKDRGGLVGKKVIEIVVMP